MLLHKGHNKEIAFVVPYPFDTAPGQRFRYEQYLNILKTEGYGIEIFPFLSQGAYESVYSSGKFIQKFLSISIGLLKRLMLLFRVVKFDYIFIFREASPIGPPWFEWIVSRGMKKKVIYDFDDAIWITDNSLENSFERFLRWRGKISSICKWSYKISCGNEYLCQYARQFNSLVILNPTTVETNLLHNPIHNTKIEDRKLVIGWTGSHSTLKYLEELEPVLQQIENNYEFVKFLVIANQPPNLKLHSLEFMPWRKETESNDLSKIDIGIMPLPDDDWTKGKCGFKALQYMAMGIPTIASPVGVNSKIVVHGKNGFLAKDQNQWISFLKLLVENSALRKSLGNAGRQDVIKHYSVASNASNFLSLFT